MAGWYGSINCPKCGKDFERTILGLNLLLFRFERCPYCKKFSFTSRMVNMNKNKIEEDNHIEIKEQTEEEKLKKKLDDSLYEDL